MEVNELGPGSARAVPPPGRDDTAAELARLRAECRRQAALLGTTHRVVATLRGGARALTAENADLRALIARLSTDAGPSRGGATLERRLRVDVKAPHAAREFLTELLGERLSAGGLERARLVVSELVTNSVRHSGADPDSDLVVRVQRTHGSVWLEVEDSGRAAMAPGTRRPAPDSA